MWDMIPGLAGIPTGSIIKSELSWGLMWGLVWSQNLDPGLNRNLGLDLEQGPA